MHPTPHPRQPTDDDSQPAGLSPWAPAPPALAGSELVRTAPPPEISAGTAVLSPPSAPTEADSEDEAVTDTHAEDEAEAATDTTADTEAAAATGPDADADGAVEPDASTDATADAEEAGTDVEGDEGDEGGTDADADAVTDADADASADTGAESDADAEGAADAATDAGDEPDAEAAAQADGSADAEGEADAAGDGDEEQAARDADASTDADDEDEGPEEADEDAEAALDAEATTDAADAGGDPAAEAVVEPDGPLVDTATVDPPDEAVADAHHLVETAGAPEPVDKSADADQVTAAPTRADLGVAGDETAAAGPLRPGDVAETPIAVWDQRAAQEFRTQWHEVKARFVDEPEAALEEAQQLVGRAVQQLADTLLAEPVDLDPRRAGDAPDTEAMRVALRRYREFLDRVLAL